MNSHRTHFVVALLVMTLYLSGCSVNQVEVSQAGSNSNPQSLVTIAQKSNPGTYQGLTVGFTEEGFPFMGDPAAPVTLEEYSDFLCPFCARHATQTFPAIMKSYLKDGRVKYVFRDMPLVGLHPTAPTGHAAARCVAEQGASYFWAMHEALFNRQNDWRQLSDPSDFLTEVVKGIGVDMNAYQNCIASGVKNAEVQTSVAAGEALGFNGTPSFQFIVNKDGKTSTLIGAQPIEAFKQQIDALLAGKEIPQEQQAQDEQEELPLWANAEGLAPDPGRPGFTLAGDPYKGNPQARVVVVEFSNFQCPSCQKHALDVQPAIDKALVDTGQVLWVFKNLPLRNLAQSAVAAVAAECAGDQGKFWEMHDQLFQNQDKWAVKEPEPVFASLASQLNMDVDRFSTCLNSRQALERVLNDMYDAQGVINTAPNFVILSGGKGSLIKGSRPAEEFVKRLQGYLDSANAEALP